MAATVVVIDDEKTWELLHEIFESQGVILVSPGWAKELEGRGLDPDGIELEEYNFGGDADHWVDFCEDGNDYSAQPILKALGECPE